MYIEQPLQLPGLPFIAEPIRTWSSRTDVTGYATALADYRHRSFYVDMESQGEPAYVVTKSAEMPDGSRAITRFIVHKGALYSTKERATVPDLSEDLYRTVHGGIQSGIDSYVAQARRFSEQVEQDLRTLVKEQDPMIATSIRVGDAGNDEEHQVTIRDLLDDPKFGYMAKYGIAWNLTEKALLEEAEFFSLAHILECTTELRCSALLAERAYYKQALQVLRNYLEMVVAQLYFCEERNAFHAWKRGEGRPPGVRGDGGMLKVLIRKGLFPYELSDRISSLYGDLNSSIHNAEDRLIHRGVLRGETTLHTFKYERLAEWCEYFGACVDVGLRSVWASVWQWKRKRPEGVTCRTCHSTERMTAVDRYEMKDRSFLTLRCSDCGHEWTFALDWLADYGYS
jgi:hypothetical protein